MPAIAKTGTQTDNGRETADLLVRIFLHALASRRSDVQAIRSEILGAQVLKLDEVRRWIREASGKPRRGKIIDHIDGAPVRKGGALERLWGFADLLHDDFVGWSQGDALHFLLTGAVVGAPSLVRDGLERTGHMIFSVNPLLSPRELADEYARIRRSVFGSRIQRLRRQKIKALRLAVFHAKRLDSKSTLRERIQEWNKLYPAEAYDPDEDVPNFWRDTRGAFTTLREQLGAYKQDGGTKE